MHAEAFRRSARLHGGIAGALLRGHASRQSVRSYAHARMRARLHGGLEVALVQGILLGLKLAGHDQHVLSHAQGGAALS